ncbi:MAG: hypothetical protein WKF87_17780 [Chryseolinea sp.]
MAGSKSVSEKLGIKKDSRAIFINADEEALEALDLTELEIATRATGVFDYIHVFTTTQKDLDQQFTKLKKRLGATGMLWVSWPKAKQKERDLDIKSVIRIGYDNGLVESKSISINETWSALKFTHPKKGKTYNNSYGKLPS